MRRSVLPMLFVSELLRIPRASLERTQIQRNIEQHFGLADLAPEHYQKSPFLPSSIELVLNSYRIMVDLQLHPEPRYGAEYIRKGLCQSRVSERLVS